MNQYNSPTLYDYKAIRKTGTLIFIYIGAVASRTDIDQQLAILQNKYVDGILFNMEDDNPSGDGGAGSSFYGAGYDAVWYLNEKTHEAGKLFIVTNAPWKNPQEHPESKYADILNTYSDAIMPWMFYAQASEMKNEWAIWKRYYTRGPTFVMGGIGGVINDVPSVASTLPGYLSDNGVLHYVIFGSSVFYTCSQGGSCSGRGISSNVNSAYAGYYKALLENLRARYDTTGIKCSQSTSPACTSADWQNQTLVNECAANPNGKKIILWTRLGDCYGGVEHLVEENTFCNASSTPVSVGGCIESGTCPVQITEDTDHDVVNDSDDLCPNTPLDTKINRVGCPMPKLGGFEKDSTNLSYKNLNLPIYNFELANSEGKIKFYEAVKLSRANSNLNIGDFVLIENSSITINSSNIPELNKSAILTFNNINFESPIVLQDGKLCNECSLMSYTNGSLVAYVPHFTTYQIVNASFLSDAPICISNCSGKQCGSDGCGSSCGLCNSCVLDSFNCVDDCSPLNLQECVGDLYKTCGNFDNDSCLEWSTGAYCEYGKKCSAGTCVDSNDSCISSCSGKQCGSDGCGGSCGLCTTEEFCNSASQCKNNFGYSWIWIVLGVFILIIIISLVLYLRRIRENDLKNKYRPFYPVSPGSNFR